MMDLEQVPPQPKRTPESAERIKRPNIRDSDILNKIAEVCGIRVDDIAKETLEQLKIYSTQINKQGVEPLKFHITAHDKFYVATDGTVKIVHGSSEEVVNRATESGMGWEDHQAQTPGKTN